MKSASLLIMFLVTVASYSVAQTSYSPQDMPGSSISKISQRRVNFYVVNKPKTLYLLSRLLVLRARKKGMTRKDKFIVIVAKSAREARDKMEDHLLKKMQ